MTEPVHPTEILTGLSDFDALAGPMPRRQITAAVGRTSSGMTAFAMSVARHNDEIGHQVAFASFESGTDTTMGYFDVAHTSVNVDRAHSIDPGRRARIDRARAAIERSNLLMRSAALRPGRPFASLMAQLNDGEPQSGLCT